MESFDSARKKLEKQYENAVYECGWTKERLQAEFKSHCDEKPDEPRVLRRAFLEELIFRHAPLATEPDNLFCGKIQTFNLLEEERYAHVREAWTREFGEFEGWCAKADVKRGVVYMVDMSHVAPDWEAILKLGLPGLRTRALQGRAPFHKAVAMVYEGAMELCRRFAKTKAHRDMAKLAERPPETLREAFQLAYLFHDLIELCGEEVRTMGRFDKLYIEFYRRDLAAGRLTRESAKELIKYFWIAFYAKYQGKRFGKNFCFGPDFNELSYLGMEVYYEMNTVDPKLSVLVRDDMPQDFLELYVKCIRDGRNSIVSLNDKVIIEGLVKHGRTPEDAKNYIPIGCYEPAVAGKEISLSGATLLFLPAMVLRALERNIGYASFADFKKAFYEELREQTIYMAKQQSRCEKIWPEINPAPMLSGTFADCMAKGKDISEGGAKYNTTGCVISYFADAVDSLAAIQWLVYEKKLCALDELRSALAADWKGYEKLQMQARNRAPKWGNNDEKPDAIGKELADFIGPFLGALPNGRGGRMFPSLYGQLVVENGKLVPALPDGRKAGTPLSKNMDACIPMDKNGVTSLMNSVLKIDMSKYPCGTCLDLMMHPSSTGGPEGIENMAAIIRTFIERGGSGLQFNIFDVKALRDAQKHPENYENLQVRVCGWNVRFIDLAPEAQATFIDQAEAISA